MEIGVLFWLVVVIAIFYGGYRNRANYYAGGNDLLTLVLICIIGYKVFGPILK